MKIRFVLGIVAAVILCSPRPAAAACMADGFFTTGNASQAWIWNLHDRGSRISGEVRYFAGGSVARATVAGKRSGATLKLTLADSSGHTGKALAGVTCSRPTPEIPVDEILFVRVARVPVPHIAFAHVRTGDEATMIATARRAGTRLPSPPQPGGLRGWLNAMDAAAR